METRTLKQKEAMHQQIEEERQYVTFLVAGETYGVTVLKVQSLNEMSEITIVPKTISFVEGVINLRGSVVPVINMRKKFNLPPKEYDTFTVILIVEVKGRLIGMIVDSVSDVVSIPVSDIQKKIKFSAKVEETSLEGVGRIGDDLVILLDVETFFDTYNLQEL